MLCAVLKTHLVETYIVILNLRIQQCVLTWGELPTRGEIYWTQYKNYKH